VREVARLLVLRRRRAGDSGGEAPPGDEGWFPTRRAAEAALAEFIGFAAKGEVASPGRRTLAAYLDEWLIGVGPTLAVAAWTNYRSVINLYVRPRIGQLQLAAVSGSTLTKLYAELLAHGGVRGKPLSATTARLVHRVLSKSFEDAVEARLLAANPARRAKVPRPGRREMKTWTAEEATRFLTFAADDRLYACWLLALVCGMRRGELAGLRWSVVEFPNETLRVVEQRTTDADWKVVTKEPKGTSRRTIDLGPLAVSALRRAHRVQMVAERLEWGAVWTDSGLVFVRADGLGYHPSRITDMFQKLSKKAGVPVIRLHDARHSCATLALSAGIHPKVVQQLLGHASWSTTMDLYSHRVERLQKDASGRIESVLFAEADPGKDEAAPGDQAAAAD
jgi:integrase